MYDSEVMLHSFTQMAMGSDCMLYHIGLQLGQNNLSVCAQATNQLQGMPTIECNLTGTTRCPVRPFESPTTLKSPQPFLCKLDNKGNRDQLFIIHVHLGWKRRLEGSRDEPLGALRQRGDEN